MELKLKKNKVVKSWVQQQQNDKYVQQAQRSGYRSRAAFKLLAINQQDKILYSGATVVDLGCAPGSWSQVALDQVGLSGKVIGVDLLEIEPLYRLNFIQGDFSSAAVLKQLITNLQEKPLDLLLSDMAPNLSGIKGVDQARSAHLIELVLDFANEYLKPQGNCLIKVFHGAEFENLLKLARKLFTQVLIRKPEASRAKSSETYLLCKVKK